MTTGGRGYRELITIQRRTVTDSRGGQPVESWSNHGKRRALIEGAGVMRTEQHNQPVHQSDYRITIPMDSELVAMDAQNIRVLWYVRRSQITLNVRTVDVSRTGRGAELVLMARKDR
jgi:head-tail adaptor